MRKAFYMAGLASSICIGSADAVNIERMTLLATTADEKLKTSDTIT